MHRALRKFTGLFTFANDSDLHPFRHGLVFSFFNTLAWQVGIGTPMILLAERLGADSFQVGLAYSFVFLMTPVQLLSTVLLSRFGFRRVTLSGWGIRSFFLGIPVILAVMAPETGERWMVHLLIWSVFFFCLFRAVGAAAIIPWLYGILPESSRGRYFSSDQFLSGVAAVGILVLCSLLFALLPGYNAFLVQYLIALAGSLISFIALSRLPDAARPDPISLKRLVTETPMHCFSRSPFRKFLWLSILLAVVTTPIPPFSVYYLKAQLQLDSSAILVFITLQSCGVITGALIMRSRLDRAGPKPFFLISLGLYAVVCLYWWFFLASEAVGYGLLPAVHVLLGLAASFWLGGNLSYLPTVVAPSNRALMVTIHGSVAAFLGGLSPLLWGYFLRGADPAGPAMRPFVFQLFFVAALAALAVALPVVLSLRESEKGAAPIRLGNAILRPFRALTFLAIPLELPKRRLRGKKPPRA